MVVGLAVQVVVLLCVGLLLRVVVQGRPLGCPPVRAEGGHWDYCGRPLLHSGTHRPPPMRYGVGRPLGSPAVCAGGRGDQCHRLVAGCCTHWPSPVRSHVGQPLGSPAVRTGGPLAGGGCGDRHCCPVLSSRSPWPPPVCSRRVWVVLMIIMWWRELHSPYMCSPSMPFSFCMSCPPARSCVGRLFGCSAMHAGGR